MTGPAERPPPPARAAAAAFAFALAVCASYAVQRLWDARTEPPMGTVQLQATIPYYWRVGVAVVHGLGAASLLGLGLSEEQALRLLRQAPWLVPLVVVPAAVAMVLVP